MWSLHRVVFFIKTSYIIVEMGNLSHVIVYLSALRRACVPTERLSSCGPV